MTTQAKATHQLPDGIVATRTTSRTYTHVVIARKHLGVDVGPWFVHSWAGRQDLAEKEARRSASYGYVDIRVEAINHGVREGA